MADTQRDRRGSQAAAERLTVIERVEGAAKTRNPTRTDISGRRGVEFRPCLTEVLERDLKLREVTLKGAPAILPANVERLTWLAEML
jgi:hypothetical protein